MTEKTYAYYRAACLGARIVLTPVPQPPRPPPPSTPSEPVRWRVWEVGTDPADATILVEREPIDAVWAARSAKPLTTVFVERADVNPIGSLALEFEVSLGVAGNRLVRHVGPLWPPGSGCGGQVPPGASR